MAQPITAPQFDINLANTLSADRVIADMVALERPGVIAELLERLDALNAIPREARPTLLNALIEKENIHTTGIGSGVAIPHCYSNAVSETVFIFGRSLQGIDFNAPDGEPVHYILLYIVPQDRHLLHLQTLRAVAKNFLSSKLRRQLLEAPDATAILEVFRKHADK
ncbi:PTS sugar transporter subunit IIA [Phragmitibacter flavus]|uniref:PTS sugar transporter subunit IIA n=1 Tax=Phragmitibacter flavus TaxID=2576071 RepID=UPI00140C83E1|nr:PTS sugar transporter subunit IIA [Phragmitibacter flavus]